MVVLMNHSVTTHALPGPCVPPLFDGVLRTCSNQPLPSGLRPSAVLEATVSKKANSIVSVSIIPNRQRSPAGKPADPEVMFEAASGPLSGMKLVGFAVWERRDGGRNVTFPARQYSVNGERRSFALLRPANGDASAQEAIKRCILDAYQRSEAHSLIDQKVPRRCGLSPAAWGRGSLPMEFVRRPHGRRLAERTPLWRP